MQTGHTPPLAIPAAPIADRQTTVTETELAEAFTEWDRRFREEPERFQSEACRLLRETPETYGAACAPYLLAIIAEQRQDLPDFDGIFAALDSAQMEDPFAEHLLAWADHHSEFSLQEAIEGALDIAPQNITRALAIRCGLVLRKLGFQRFMRRKPYSTISRYVYAKPTSTGATLTRPALAEGEIYVGAIISACGTYSNHTILLPGDHDDATWQDAMDWAKSLGGDLPNRIEQALLFATLKDQFKADWYWSNTQHAAYSDYAWYQYFGNGHQSDYHISVQCRARAVRRLPIQPFTNLL